MNQNFSREERKRMIVMAFLVDIQQRQGGEMTSYRIARKIGVSPSSHLRSILAEMVRDGILECWLSSNIPGRWDTVKYRLPKGSYVDPHEKKRVVTVKAKGKPVDQLELF